MRVIMITKDAVKARIKKLECDMLGLTYQLSLMRSAPAFSSAASLADIFKMQSTRKPINSAFDQASHIQDVITRQIMSIRDELASLRPSLPHGHDFRLTA